jgi:hypothetical protein
MSESSINTLIGTFSSLGSVANKTVDATNLICIDTSDNRIGINTIDPSYSIMIVDTNPNSSANRTIGIYTPRLYFDLSKIARDADSTNIPRVGEVYVDFSGFLKVKLS